MDLINFENVTVEDAEQAVRIYNAGTYAKAGVKNTNVDTRARELFADGLGVTVERVILQLTYIGREYGGVAGFPAALILAPAIGRDIFADRVEYEAAICRAQPLRDALPTRDALELGFHPFVKELHGKKHWMTWATKFWHFLNVETFLMEDSTVDKFFKLQNKAVSLDKYEQLLELHTGFTAKHEAWLPRLKAVDAGLAWSDIKLWDKVCYGMDAINKQRKGRA